MFPKSMHNINSQCYSSDYAWLKSIRSRSIFFLNIYYHIAYFSVCECAYVWVLDLVVCVLCDCCSQGGSARRSSRRRLTFVVYTYEYECTCFVFCCCYRVINLSVQCVCYQVIVKSEITYLKMRSCAIVAVGLRFWWTLILWRRCGIFCCCCVSS